MSVKYKFRRLKEYLIKKPYHRYGYRIEKYGKGFITFEKHGVQSNIDYICKRLGLIQIGKPLFLIDIIDFDPTLAGLFYMKCHGEIWWISRIWDKKSEQIKQQKDREYRDMIREQTEKIKNIYTIFREKW